MCGPIYKTFLVPEIGLCRMKVCAYVVGLW